MFERVQHWDNVMFIRLFAKTKQHGVKQASLWVSKSADGYLYVLLMALFWGSGNDDLARICQVMALAFCVERPLYFVLKNSVRRNRPFRALKNLTAHIRPSDEFSMPSGHTAAAFLFATILAHYFPVLAPMLLLWAVSVGLSRVLLGVHYPIDTLIGATIGTSIAVVAIGVLG